MSTKNFYDKISPYYHLIYADWEAGILRQAKALDKIIKDAGISKGRVLDVACGIGTQALGLARLGYSVEASDLSGASIRRARLEAKKRSLKIKFSVADMTRLSRQNGQDFDVVMACDNALPHLLTDRKIVEAFKEAKRCLRPGGLYLISVRDYDLEQKSAAQFKPYGIRKTKLATYALFQTWHFAGSTYEVSMYAIEERPGSPPKMQVARSTYYAIGIGRLCTLLRKAGFRQVRRIDGNFFQPVLLGMKPAFVKRK